MRVDRKQAAKARRMAVKPRGIETRANLQQMECRLNELYSVIPSSINIIIDSFLNILTLVPFLNSL
jgi:hypothetical protein